MSVGRRFGSWLKSIVRRERLESDMDAELRFHIEQRADDWMRDADSKGMTREEALRRARLEFGAVDKVKEECREARGASWVESLTQDLRFGVRTMRRSPGFTAVAVLSLGLGIGANTAIFTLINDILLKSLPVRDPQRLVTFGKESGAGIVDGISGSIDLFPYDFFKSLQAHDEAFQDITAYSSFQPSATVRRNDVPNSGVTTAVTHLVAGNFFDVLGAEPLMGRTLEPSDDNGAASRPVAVISYGYWQRGFGGQPDVLGKTMLVNSTGFTVIGVMPPKFYGVELDDNPPDMWLPIGFQEQVMLMPSLLGPQGLYWTHMMGRAKPSVTRAQSQQWVGLKLREYMTDREGADLTPERKQEIAKSYIEMLPGAAGISNTRQDYEQPLEILMGVVVLVLMIACANLANFLLAKAASREQEIATRLALGAGRARVVRQMLTETLLLSFCGGALGVLLAYWGTAALIRFVSDKASAAATSTPFDAAPDARVLAFAFGLSLVTGILFGLGPAMRVSRIGLANGMKASSRNLVGMGTRFAQWMPKLLVAGQVAMSLVLLVGAGLFLRTLRNLENQNFGFDRTNLLLVNFEPKIAGYKSEKLDSFYQQIADRVQALPGVRSVALSGAPVISRGSWSCPLFVKGRVTRPEDDTQSTINRVSAGYFETVGIPLVQGRLIGPQDGRGAPQVVVINETLAKHLFPKGDAIGQTVTFGDPSVEGEWQIVGIVKDTKSRNPRDAAQRMTYPSLLQLTGDDRYAFWMQVRTSGDPAQVAGEVRGALAAVDENLPVPTVRTIHDHLGTFTKREALISQLSGFFAVLALLLVCIGLYGVMTYSVVRRTNEIGIRMALGAQADGVLWMVLRESVIVLAVGVAVGVPVTLAASRLVQSRLFGLSASDPVTLIAAVAGVSAVTLVCAYLPARRATKVDPIVALRYE